MNETTAPTTDWVLHVDLDQFIAAVEVLRRPELAGLPVVVGGRGDPTERGVVATASYEARAFGVGSGMPLRIAARKCPDAVFLPVDKPAYDAASAGVMASLRAREWGGVPVVVEVLGLLADRTRLGLLRRLGEGEADVTTLTEACGASRTSVSQHLARLRLAGRGVLARVTLTLDRQETATFVAGAEPAKVRLAPPAPPGLAAFVYRYEA